MSLQARYKWLVCVCIDHKFALNHFRHNNEQFILWPHCFELIPIIVLSFIVFPYFGVNVFKVTAADVFMLEMVNIET